MPKLTASARATDGNADAVINFVSLADALIRDMKRFQRAAGAADRLHVPRDEKCRECRKPWPCPTNEALNSGLHWNGREEGEAAMAAGGQSHG